MPDFKLNEAFASDSGAEEYKKKGNEAFQAQSWDEAIKNYNKAIQLDPKQAAFYSNRAACWSSKGNHESALNDANKCLETDPNFLKGFSRKGKALFDLNKFDEAEAAYKEGLDKDPAAVGCVNGLADVQRAKSQARSRASASSTSSSGIGGMGKKLFDTIKKGSIGGRMQMYAVLAAGYFMYNTWTGGNKRSKTATAGHDVEDDDEPASTSSMAKLHRSFAEIDGNWVSYIEAGKREDSLLVFLHRTSLSADAEHGAAIGRVLEKATSAPPGGLRIIAPDRPCHGYSPCPSGKASSANWLDGLLAARPKSKKLTLVASGRAAARQALALAKERAQAVRLLLVNPSMSGPSRGALADSMADAADLQKWLGEQQKAGAVTAGAAADAARWAIASNEEEEDDKLVATGLPEGSQVTTLYLEGEKEDSDLKEEIEGLGLSLKVKQAASGDALLDAVVAEAWRMSTTELEAEEEEA